MAFSDVCSVIWEIGKKAYQKAWDFRDEVDNCKSRLENCSDDKIKKSMTSGGLAQNLAAREIWQERMDSKQEDITYNNHR